MARKDDDEDLEDRLDAAAEDAEDEEEEEPEKPAPLPVMSPRRKKRRRVFKRAGRSEDAPGVQATVGLDAQSRALADKDIGAIWEYVLRQAEESQSSPERIAITVKRCGTGMYPGETEDCGTITGSEVMGDGQQVGPGEALKNYITDIYHLPTQRTPKLYKCWFQYRTGTRNHPHAPVGELRLGHPQQIIDERAAKARMLNQKRIDEAVKSAQAGVASQPQVVPGFSPLPHPQYPGYPSYVPPYVPPPAAGESEQLTQLRMQLSQITGMFNERARQEGLQQIAPAPVAAPPPPDPAAQAAIMARAIAETMAAMGFTPALAQKLNAPPQPLPITGDSMDRLEDAFTQVDRFEKMMDRIEDRAEERRRRRREEDEPEEEPKKELAPPPTGPIEIVKIPPMKAIPIVRAFGKEVYTAERGEDEGQLDYVVRHVLSNLEPISEVLQRVPLGQLGTLIQRFTAMGMPVAAAAAQARLQQAPAQVVQQPAPQPAPQANGTPYVPKV